MLRHGCHHPRRCCRRRGLAGDRRPCAGRLRLRQPDRAPPRRRERPAAGLHAERRRPGAGLAQYDDRRPDRRRRREPLLRRGRPRALRRDGGGRPHGAAGQRRRGPRPRGAGDRDAAPAAGGRPGGRPRTGHGLAARRSATCRVVQLDRTVRGLAADAVTWWTTDRRPGRRRAPARARPPPHRPRLRYAPDRSSAERIAGYRRALRLAGLEVEPELVSIGGSTQEEGHRAALDLLAASRGRPRSSPPTTS